MQRLAVLTAEQLRSLRQNGASTLMLSANIHHPALRCRSMTAKALSVMLKTGEFLFRRYPTLLKCL